MFREETAPEHKELVKEFTNMVMFCRKTASNITFREPTPADFLGSHAREQHLLPKHEIDQSMFDRGDIEVLRKGKTKVMEKYQVQSALGHWRIMRLVLPDFVWENW